YSTSYLLPDILSENYAVKSIFLITDEARDF
ncbi:MAG: hypothetical protein JWQ11_2369, partial [Rhizobacter sp.]|nr:hypothetical protein [Rhizobacter sp.]